MIVCNEKGWHNCICDTCTLEYERVKAMTSESISTTIADEAPATRQGDTQKAVKSESSDDTRQITHNSTPEGCTEPSDGSNQGQIIDERLPIDRKTAPTTAPLPAGGQVSASTDDSRSQLELAYKHAKLISESTLIPREFQNNVSNVMIAQNMATRLGADVMMVMQSLYIVHGKPAWSSQFLIGMFNSCGRYSAIKYEFNEKRTACKAHTIELATGEEITGPTVSLEMAKAEGWSTKSGSKWKNLSQLMLQYRAATFLIRTTAPELGLGLYTADELHDIN